MLPSERMVLPMKKILTLCLIHQGSQILLGMKKRGFGSGKWNGFGGKLEKGETIEQAARREVREEAGIDVQDLEKMGILEFFFQDTGETLEVHVFRSHQFLGTVQESDEMKPQWFDISEIPYDRMWQDDPYWLPLLLDGKTFMGRFCFDVSGNLLSHILEELSDSLHL